MRCPQDPLVPQSTLYQDSLPNAQEDCREAKSRLRVMSQEAAQKEIVLQDKEEVLARREHLVNFFPSCYIACVCCFAHQWHIHSTGSKNALSLKTLCEVVLCWHACPGPSPLQLFMPALITSPMALLGP